MSYVKGRPLLRREYIRKHWVKRLHATGGSLSLYLPYPLCVELGLKNGAEVWVYLVGKAIVLQKAEEVHFTPLVAQRDLGSAEKGAGE